MNGSPLMQSSSKRRRRGHTAVHFCSMLPKETTGGKRRVGESAKTMLREICHCCMGCPHMWQRRGERSSLRLMVATLGRHGLQSTIQNFADRKTVQGGGKSHFRWSCSVYGLAQRKMKGGRGCFPYVSKPKVGPSFRVRQVVTGKSRERHGEGTFYFR